MNTDRLIRHQNALSLNRAAIAINQDPALVTDRAHFYQFLPQPDTAERAEAERLRYFAMARILTEAVVPHLDAMRTLYPPYGLPEIYITENMSSPDWRAVTSLEPDEMILRKTKWATFHYYYDSKIIIALHNSLAKSLETMPAVVSQMAQHTEQWLFGHENTKPDNAKAYDRLSQQALHANDVMTGLLRLIPQVDADSDVQTNSGQVDFVAIARNSKYLPLAISNLSLKQFQHLLHEILEGEDRIPDIEGWNFNPKYFHIEFTPDSPEGRLATTSPLPDIETTYGIERVEDPENNISPRFNIPKNAPRISLKDISAQAGDYGCPAHQLIAAMWEDMTDIVDQAGFYNSNN